MAVRSAPPAARSLWPAILLGWAIAATVLTATASSAIAHLRFPDPDDAMRLLEVRDWLAGQSWWDVGQHRLNGGAFAMHWSRLVDLPLAAVLATLDPITGPAVATRVAMVAVPLATLLATIAIAAHLTRRLADAGVAREAILLTPLSVPLVYQIRPMRIDHHGWQVVLALAAATALVGTPNRRSGAVVGLMLATLITVSLEGMPITVAIVAVALLAWVFDPARRGQALSLVATLPTAATLLHAATRGPGMFAPACDAISPAWLIALGVGSAGAALAIGSAPRTSAGRLALLTGAGLAALVTLLLLAPACLNGPFATLDPLVKQMWYDKVDEGLPVWQQTPAWALMTIAFPIVGLIGTARAWRRAEGAARQRWTMIGLIAAAAFVLSLMVMRAGATANALALPGGACLLHAMLTSARRLHSVAVRVAATAGALIVATPGLAATWLFSLPGPERAAVHGAGVGVARCDLGYEMADLHRLPPATLFAPLDVTPATLAWTDHRAVASGYHRNVAAIHRVLAAFIADPATARPIVLASGATYVVGCPGENETELYKQVAPDGLWARLERGEHIPWLRRVPLSGSPVLVWRVVDPALPPPEPLSEALTSR